MANMVKKKIKWIKTADKLPEDGQLVVIAVLHRYGNCPWEFTVRAAQYKNNDRWLDIYGGSDQFGYHSLVTPEYWSPLIYDYHNVKEPKIV